MAFSGNPPTSNDGPITSFSSIFPGTEMVTEDQGNVTFVRSDIARMFYQYQTIFDCVAGEVAVKSQGDYYLPRPNPDDISTENLNRYRDYKTRAVFYGVTERTLEGLVGEVFNVEPTIEVPKALDAVVKDGDGSGIPLAQIAQMSLSTVLAYGRAGLFTDYPRTDGEAISLQDMQTGAIRPTINHYEPWNITNWRYQRIGGESVITLVVLREPYEAPLGVFGTKRGWQYRVLSIDGAGYYRQDMYQPDQSGGVPNVPTWSVWPTDAKGMKMKVIPFIFIGSKKNSAFIDKPPMYSLASLNIAHYRNSADYEDACFMVGQPTPVIIGVTEQWFQEVLKGKFLIGSRAALPLPEGGSFEMVAAGENGMIKEAMDQKERQMVALGAKLVEQKQVQRTATDANIERSSEVSVLATITKNVAAAFKFSLEMAAIFVGSTTIVEDANTNVSDGIRFDLNTEFSLADATPQDIAAVIKAWQSEAISFSEMRGKLRRTGYATQSDEVAKQQIQEETLNNANFNAGLGLNVDGTPINGNNSGQPNLGA